MSDQNSTDLQILRDLQTALDTAISNDAEAERRRIKGAREATRRSALFAGYSGKAEYVESLSARARSLDARIEGLDSVLPDEIADKLRNLTAGPGKDVSAVFGHVVVKPDFVGKVVLTDENGTEIGEAPLDTLGQYYLTTDAEVDKAFLEVRDKTNRVVHLEGAEVSLAKGVAVESSFRLKDGGRLKPEEPSDPDQPTMPDLTGMPFGEAEKKLAELGKFKVSVTGAHSDAEPDRVITQAPDPGHLLRPGELILLTVSLGEAKETPMPDLTGLPEREFRKVLANLTFRSVSFDEKVDPENVGNVLDQTPATGKPVGSETDIVLVIGVKQRTMPDVTGKTEDEARAALAGEFAVAPTIKTKVHDGASGIVLGQSPVSGKPVTGKITLTVSAPRKKTSSGRLAAPKMPDLEGKTRTQAIKALSALGIDKPVFDDAASKRRGNKVVDQSPKAGTVLKYGQNVSLAFGSTK